MKTFNQLGKNVERARMLTHTGDIRLTAVPCTGGGVQEIEPGLLYGNGAIAVRATYKPLFDLIGTTFNTGGETGLQFRLPDYRGLFLAGVTDGSAAAIKISALVLGGILGAESIALAKANLPLHAHALGTINISASGSHQHAPGGFAGSKNTAASNDFAFWAEFLTVQQKAVDGGTITAIGHDHPNSEWAGSSGDGSTVGESSLSGTAHQNVHPHQAIGGILVAY